MDEDVSLDFTADVAEAVADVDELKDSTAEMAAAVTGAKDELDGLRDSAAEAAVTQDSLRDHLAEVAAAAGIYTDEMGRLRDAQGKFVAQSTLEDLALGKTRDEALEAAAAFKALREEKSNSSGGGGSGILKDLGGAGGGAGGGGGASGLPLIGGLADALPLIAALLPLIMAALTEVGALSVAFTAAGLGVGSFAALAVPAFKQVFGALGDTKAQLEKLPAPVQQAVAGVKGLKDGFDQMSKAFQPTALAILNQGLKIAGQLLPFVGQLANAVAPSIEQILSGISRFVASPNFQDFMRRMEELSGKVLTAVASGLAGLLPRFMQLFNLFSDKDVINAVNIAFRLLGFAIQLVVGLIMESMDTWDWLTQTALPGVAHAFDTVRHTVASWGHDVSSTFDGVRHTIASWGHDIASDFDSARSTVAGWYQDVVGFFDKVKSTISGWVTDLKNDFDKVKTNITNWANDVKADVDKVGDWFKALPGQIMSWLASLPGKLVQYGKDLVNGLISGVESMGGTLLNAIENLIPGPIKSIVSTALGIFSPSTVFRGYGQNIVQGLVNGIRENVPDLHAAMSTVTGAVAGTGSAMAASAVSPSSALTHNVNVQVSAQAGAVNPYQGPQFEQYMQRQVQEAILRYAQINPTNGLTPAWGR